MRVFIPINWVILFSCFVYRGELVSGITMLTAFQTDKKEFRGIVVKISTEYVKKAKGRILATSSLDTSRLNTSKDFVVESILTNDSGEELAKCFVSWTVSRKQTNGKEKLLKKESM